MNNLVRGREMEMLCRHRATQDTIHRWKWLGEAEGGGTSRNAKPLLDFKCAPGQWR
jgi:hypothetical protein